MTALTVIDPSPEDIAGKIVSRLPEWGASSRDFLIRGVMSPLELIGSAPDVLVLSVEAALDGRCGVRRVSCGILVLPGDADPGQFDARCVVTYGMSPKNTITLSSIGEETCVIALQREMPTVRGNVLERQELKVKSGMRPYSLMAVVGALLASGLEPPVSPP